MKLKEIYSQIQDEQNQPQINMAEVKQQFNEQIAEFKNHGNVLYNMGSYRKIAEYFTKLSENAENYILSESGESWFDDITVKRNLKELKNYANDFAKVSGEAQSLQERMAALYEDMGVILNRYFDVPDAVKSENTINESPFSKKNVLKKNETINSTNTESSEFKFDYKLISNIEFAGIDHRDAPEYTDAYIQSADYDGKPMTTDQIDALNDDYDYVHEQLDDYIH